MEQHILTPVVIECIANVLGDTSEGLTGSEIHKMPYSNQVLKMLTLQNTKTISTLQMLLLKSM